MKANYHTHTPRCKHATGADDLYFQAAIRAGFDTLGFSDHTPWPYHSNYVSGIRMELDQFSEYVTSLRNLKEKYRDQLNILIGLECEYFPRYMSWLTETKEAYGLDYLIFGAHFISSDEDNPYIGHACRDNAVMFQYADMCVEGIQSGHYTYLAHPDLFMRCREIWDAESHAAARTICACALEHDLPLEYNINAYVIGGAECLFPRREFWELAAQMGNKVIIGYDAHQPEMLENTSAAAQTETFLHSLGIMPIKSLAIQPSKPQLCGQIQGGTL